MLNSGKVSLTKGRGSFAEKLARKRENIEISTCRRRELHV